MKRRDLIKLLNEGNMDDDILVQCGKDTATGKLKLKYASEEGKMEGPRRMILFPSEGEWKSADTFLLNEPEEETKIYCDDCGCIKCRAKDWQTSDDGDTELCFDCWEARGDKANYEKDQSR